MISGSICLQNKPLYEANRLREIVCQSIKVRSSNHGFFFFFVGLASISRYNVLVSDLRPFILGIGLAKKPIKMFNKFENYGTDKQNF